ncbi:LysR substrate-binding domain-containing protein [Castellaniella sp.]|uniref:LysR substrate-binding domain-containing protein n=1 Tax=Castellaniella sp. TaxID=1955812 RepID=UPI003A948BF8
MNDIVQAADFGFFSVLASAGSLSAAARELGLTPAAVSKRLSQMERRAGVPLVTRTTRRMMLTPEGEVYLQHARRVLEEVDTLSSLLGGAKQRPTGLLRVNATLGFGRRHVAPLISSFIAAYPGVSAQLQLSASPPLLTDDTYDVCVRFGEPPDGRVVAKWLAPNRRLLCATPEYLARRGNPETPRDLTRHSCITIRQGDEAYGVWRLSSQRAAAGKAETVRIHGPLTTNDGEIAVRWALAHHGIVMRSEWDIQEYLQDGRMRVVLPDYATPDADIYAVYAQQHQFSTRVRAFVDYLAEALGEARGARAP